jgi:hypothetical protein
VTAPPRPVGGLLDAVARLFDTYVLGPDRARQVATYLDITASTRGTAQADDISTAPADLAVLARASDLDFGLANVPSPQVRRLLDAFATEIHYNPQQRCIRIAVRVSTRLYPVATGTSLGLVVPDGWPALNPEAAHALLRLLTHVAEARTGGPHPRSTT